MLSTSFLILGQTATGGADDWEADGSGEDRPSSYDFYNTLLVGCESYFQFYTSQKFPPFQQRMVPDQSTCSYIQPICLCRLYECMNSQDWYNRASDQLPWVS